jgi:hypothetical protein
MGMAALDHALTLPDGRALVRHRLREEVSRDVPEVVTRMRPTARRRPSSALRPAALLLPSSATGATAPGMCAARRTEMAILPVGLLYVGAVLFLNGLLLIGVVEGRAAAPLNLFVGALQVVVPTYLIFTANGDPRLILAASGLYLFGFTYLYVGIGLLAGLDTTGVGWFSLFVAVVALGYSAVNFTIFNDRPFGVIWLYWAFLWSLFFVVLGLKRESLTRYTGWVTIITAWVTAAIPAFLLLTNLWRNPNAIALGLAIGGVVVFGALFVVMRRAPREPAPTPAPSVPARAR